MRSLLLQETGMSEGQGMSIKQATFFYSGSYQPMFSYAAVLVMLRGKVARAATVIHFFYPGSPACLPAKADRQAPGVIHIYSLREKESRSNFYPFLL